MGVVLGDLSWEKVMPSLMQVHSHCREREREITLRVAAEIYYWMVKLVHEYLRDIQNRLSFIIIFIFRFLFLYL